MIITMIVNAAYVFCILQFIQQFIFTNRSMKIQVIASISSSVILMIFPAFEWLYAVNFLLTIFVCFPLRHWLKASFAALCTASLIGGMLFVLHSIWPSSTNIQLLLFLIISFILLLQLISFIQASSKKTFVVQCGVRFLDEWLEVKGFIDSGNSCVEPISQYPVHFLLPHMLDGEKYQEIKQLLTYWKEHQRLNDEYRDLFAKLKCRFIQLQTVQSSTSVVIGIPGEWGSEQTAIPCYFVFLLSNNRFPNGAQVLLHQSLLHHPKYKEGMI